MRKKKKHSDHFVLINRPRCRSVGWNCRAGIIIFLKLIRSWENINITFQSVIYRISTRVFASIFHCALSDWIYLLFIFWYNFCMDSFLYFVFVFVPSCCFRLFSDNWIFLWTRCFHNNKSSVPIEISIQNQHLNDYDQTQQSANY